MYPPEPIPPKPLTVAQAIALVEGWYAHGAVANRPQRNNNPGDLEYHSWMMEKYGAVIEKTQGKSMPRFARFQSAATGWQALKDLLFSDAYNTLSVAEVVNKFAPPTENNDTMYVEFVCRWTGKQPNDLANS